MLPRSTKPIRRRKKRTAAEERDRQARIYGTDERRAWMHSQPCCITGEQPVEIVHVATGGMGFKADASETVPMAARLHRELHQHGVKTFEAKYDVELRTLARYYESKWRATQPGQTDDSEVR